MDSRNILVLAEGQLGDLLLLTPALHAIRNGNPDARLTVLIFHRHRTARAGAAHLLFPSDGTGSAAVLTSHPSVDEVLEANRSDLRAMRGWGRISGEASLVREIRKRGFDTVLCTFPEDRFAVLAFLSGARKRVGQKDQSLSWLLNVTPAITKRTIGVLEYYCRLAECCGGKVENRQTKFHMPTVAMESASDRLRELGLDDVPWIAVHPGASGDYKVWPPGRYAALIDMLRARRVPVVLFSGHADGAILDAVTNALAAPVPVILTGDDVPLLGAFLQRAALCISNDSGPRHLAVAVGTPSLALFRRFHGKEWNVYPETDACATLTGREECPVCPAAACLDRIPPTERFGSACMRQIGAEQVLQRSLEMMGRSRPHA
ncbi:MAG: glycosyltransferase family 9 protein [Bacteroidetes bacterium]|nr:glycosyltransferase family 9 protein [Bacteroidota bacterium]